MPLGGPVLSSFLEMKVREPRKPLALKSQTGDYFPRAEEGCGKDCYLSNQYLFSPSSSLEIVLYGHMTSQNERLQFPGFPSVRHDHVIKL